MKTEKIKTYKTRYTCEVCGYWLENEEGYDYYKNEILKHEREHNRNKPFNVGDVVSWSKPFHWHDHGKPCTDYVQTEGAVIKVIGNKALVELQDGTREKVGCWKLKAVLEKE